MNILRKLLLGIAFMGLPLCTNAQNGWFYGVDGAASNYWTSQVLSAADIGINALIGKGDMGHYHLGYNYLNLKENGDKVSLKRGKANGFSMSDLTNRIEFGAKVGYMSPTSPIGVYVKAYYGYQRFRTQFLQDDSWMKHKIHSFIPGIGVRISPFTNWWDEYEWYPFVEIGTSYVYHFKYDGPYGSDRNQLNNGMRTSYAIGAGFGDEDEPFTVLLGFEMDNFDMFNKDYSPDGGVTKPFAFTSSHNYYFYIKAEIPLDFFE